MVKYLLAFGPALLFWLIFVLVIFNLDYPKSLTQASLLQLIAFFGSLYVAITLSLNIIYKNLIACLIISLGLVIMLMLKAFDSLNIVTVILLCAAVWLLVSYFKTSK